MAKGKKVAIVLLATFGILGVAAGATAIATKGFTQWGVAEKVVKGGYAVDKFTVDSLTGSTLRLVNSDDVKLSGTIEGSIDEKEALILGDTEAAATSKATLETLLHTYNAEPKDIEKIEGMTVAMDLVKYSKLSLTLNVEYKEASASSGAIKLPYFDAIRVNYKIPGSRMTLIGKSDGDSKKSLSYQKRTNTVTSLYENEKLFELEKEATKTENIIDFYSFSLDASKDNTMEIQSIELVRTTTSHADDFCWVTQA